MTYRKKLIEVALPLEAINVASAREKSIRHGHPSTLHLWWARRPLAACRAVIFSSLVDDPGHHPEDQDDPITAPPEFIEACKQLPLGKNSSGLDEKGRSNDTPRMRLFDFIELLVQWESTTDEQVLETARHLIRLATDGNPPPLLDPFAGGGSIPLEAQRLGLEAHASDLNPVAVMICKALIEIPPKFANRPPVNPRDRQGTAPGGSWEGVAGLAADVRYYGEWMRERALEKIGHHYPDYNGETVIAWLWARTVKCPNPACGMMMPLVRSFDLSKKKLQKAWVVPQVSSRDRTISFAVKEGNGKGQEGTVDRRGARCLSCGTPVPLDHVRAEGRAGRMDAQLMAVVTEGKGKRNYRSPILAHEHVAKMPPPENTPETSLPEQALGFRVQLYGMTKHRDLFTTRQLVALGTLSDLVAEAQEWVYADAVASGLPDDDVSLREGGGGARAYAEAARVYLAFVVDRFAPYCNSLASWHSSADKVRATFARQALSMVWDYAEVNPFSGSTGNFGDNVEWVAQAIENLRFASDSCSGIALQADAAVSTSHSELTVLSTDPPYYDNIGYADLSDFFYVWMRRNLRDVYPELFGTLLVPKESELIANPFRFNGSRDSANKHFENGLEQAFTNMHRIVSQAYPLSVYYAFKQAESDEEDDNNNASLGNKILSSTGWETMLNGLMQAGFAISGTWPIRTELGNRPRNLGANALASSIVLVCRPRSEDASPTTRAEFIKHLRVELPAGLREMQSGNIAPVDLAQASIGPGMAVYSRYSKVLEPNGERLTVRTALQIINQVLDEFLAEQEGHIDPETRFAVAWFEQFGFNAGEFGTADVLARAKNTAVNTIAEQGIVNSRAGKVQLIHWNDAKNPKGVSFEPGKFKPESGTAWEATHHLIYALNLHGESGAAMLLAKMPPDLAASARHLAYRLYSICERKGWADHARDYNALVISWGQAQQAAVAFREQYQQGKLFE